MNHLLDPCQRRGVYGIDPVQKAGQWGQTTPGRPVGPKIAHASHALTDILATICPRVRCYSWHNFCVEPGFCPRGVAIFTGSGGDLAGEPEI